MKIEIYLNGVLVDQGKDRMVLARRGRAIGIDLISIQEVISEDNESGAIVTVWFKDCSWSIFSLSDYARACRYFRRCARHNSIHRFDCYVNRVETREASTSRATKEAIAWMHQNVEAQIDSPDYEGE